MFIFNLQWKSLSFILDFLFYKWKKTTHKEKLHHWAACKTHKRNIGFPLTQCNISVHWLFTESFLCGYVVADEGFKWVINAVAGTYIHLLIQSLEMEVSPQCTKSYLAISQGQTQDNPLQLNETQFDGDSRVEGPFNLAALGLDSRVDLEPGVIARYVVNHQVSNCNDRQSNYILTLSIVTLSLFHIQFFVREQSV